MLLVVGHLSAGEPGKVETVATGLRFPEGTVFVGNTLYFVDYGSSDVLRLVDGAVQKVWHQDGCGANGLAQAGRSLLVACYDSGTIAEIALDGRLIDTIRSDVRGLPFLHPNDLAADQKGGVYFTASGSDTAPGKVYYRGADRRVREVASNIHYANGVTRKNSSSWTTFLRTQDRRRSHRMVCAWTGTEMCLSRCIGAVALRFSHRLAS
jgi:gluconolactonase